MDNADRLEQLDLMVGMVGRVLSPDHGREARHLFEDANEVHATTSPRGDVATMWSSRRSPHFPEGAWLELGPETAAMFWAERVDPQLRADMLELMAELRELRDGRPLRWRKRGSPAD